MSEPWEQWTQKELDDADERETMMAQSIEFQLGEEIIDLRERNAQLETTVRQLVANNDALQDRSVRLLAALEAMLVDPPSTLDEPDTDADIIRKLRDIAREALAR